MSSAYAKIRQIWKEKDLPDFRTAAFLTALEKVATSYAFHGIFP